MQFIEEQAIDRVHRLNQTIDVVVYKITIRGTVEERILALQDKKRELANAAVEGKAVGKLSMKDIMQLFRHDGGGIGPVQEADVDVAIALARGPVLKPASTGRTPSVGRTETTAARPGKSGSGSDDPVWGRRW